MVFHAYKQVSSNLLSADLFLTAARSAKYQLYSDVKAPDMRTYMDAFTSSNLRAYVLKLES